MPVKDRITNLLIVLDSVIVSVDDIMNEDFKKNLGGTMDNLNNTTGSLGNILGSKETEIESHNRQFK